MARHGLADATAKQPTAALIVRIGRRPASMRARRPLRSFTVSNARWPPANASLEPLSGDSFGAYVEHTFEGLSATSAKQLSRQGKPCARGLSSGAIRARRDLAHSAGISRTLAGRSHTTSKKRPTASALAAQVPAGALVAPNSPASRASTAA